jgi:acetyl esterase
VGAREKMDTTMSLDREIAESLSELPGGFDPGAHLRDLNVIRMLRSTLGLLEVMGGVLPVDERVTVVNRRVPVLSPADEIEVRIYEPAARSAVALPGVVFFHGGAFVLGDVYSEELRCLRYAAGASCVVVSVGYRLAPEHPYPVPFEDCYAGLLWTFAHAGELGIDPARIAVAGSSAGGALAAAVSLKARDHCGPSLVFQLLVYPVLDDRMDTASMRCFNDSPLWTNTSSADMWDHYLGESGSRGEVPEYAAPARAADLAGLPSALVVTAEIDPLRDEGIAYAQRLMGAGVPTELHSFSGACHGFDILAASSSIGRRALAEQVDALSRSLGAGS